MSNKQKRKLSKAEAAAKAQRRANHILALKTLISNDACIQTSREWSGFKGHGVPVIIAILSVLLAIIPSFVTRITVNAGDTFLGSPSYSYDTGLSEFTKAMSDNSVHITIKNGAIVTEGNVSSIFNYPANPADEGTTEMKWYHVSTNRFEKETTVFEVFLNNKADLEDKDFFNNVMSNTDGSKTPDGKWRPTKITWNYLAIGKNSMVFAKFNPTKGTMVTYMNGQYDRLENVDLAAQTVPENPNAKGYDYITGATAKWKVIINQSYETQKIAGTFQYVGILSGVYAGLMVLFGFLIWVMTRGKNNPLRVFTVWETQRMSYWASFSPAVLSIIGGFLLRTSTIGMFAFIFIFGMRLMWMSMKALRPMQ